MSSEIAEKRKGPSSLSGVPSMPVSELRDVRALSLLIIDCTNFRTPDIPRSKNVRFEAAQGEGVLKV
ncbi:MAG: hypothetical protein ACP5E2_14075, partial [Terracidiphilus sp.]